jgi:hypothetical protein
MKSESPPFRMVVSAGKLTPADAYTAERLDTYRNGSALLMQPVIDTQSPRRRQYWAILARVIADCPSPWRRVSEANNALKSALGVVEHGRSLAGVDTRYVKSLNDLQEPEFETFFEDAMLMLHRLTGVDPLTLGKEASDTGDDAMPAGGNSPATPGEDGGGKPPQSSTAAVDNSLKAEAVDKFLQYACDDSLSPEVRLDGLLNILVAWVEKLPDEAQFLNACMARAADVINGKTTKKAAKSYLLALASKEGKSE